MLDQLTADTFEPHRDSAFIADLPEGHDPLSLELTEVNPLAVDGTSGRKQFSLVFRGPAEPVLNQRMWTLRHDELGELALFLVPIGPDRDERMQYEAVFT